MTQPQELVALALQQASAVFAKLTTAQLRDFAEGRAHIVFRSGDTIVPPEGKVTTAPAGPQKAPAGTKLDAAEAVAAINGMTTRDEVAAYLDTHDRALTVPTLREVAQRLGPTVANPSKATKAVLKRNIVEGTAGFRERSAAMSGGAWA